MEKYLTAIFSAILTFIVHVATKYFEPKAKLVYWSPHSFSTHIDKDIPLFMASLFITNMGNKEAEDIEIVHQIQPDHFVLQPPLSYTTGNTPTGEHIIKVSRLAGKEQFAIQLVGYAFFPKLIYIRSNFGLAKYAPVRPVFITPRWRGYVAKAIFYFGVFNIAYWVIEFIRFIIGHIG